MGYTTEFEGSIKIEPPLNYEEAEYLRKFNETRHMAETDSNRPPKGQPGLWCQWIPTSDGASLEWDGGEKFYDSPEWMKYLIEHFIGSDPIDKTIYPCFTGHVCNGSIIARGEDRNDVWKLIVKDNVVFVAKLKITPEELRFENAQEI